MPKTYQEAMLMGYHEAERTLHQSGKFFNTPYISRKILLADAPVCIGKGKRKGQLYVWHNDGRNGYMTRIYLTK